MREYLTITKMTKKHTIISMKRIKYTQTYIYREICRRHHQKKKQQQQPNSDAQF